MRLLFNPGKSRTPVAHEPVHADVPTLVDAELAAVYNIQRRAGDFYDFIRVSPARVLFCLLDVAGRLLDNRAIVSAAQRTFRTLAVELFVPPDINEAEAMIELCLELNRTILKSEGGVRACPAFAGCYNEHVGIVSYFNAGHTPGLVLDGKGVSRLEATGCPLGLFTHFTHDAAMVALQPGARLLLVSRGLVEGKYKGEEFGLQRVADVLQQTTSGGAQQLCLTVLERVEQFARAPLTHDDATALALVRFPTGVTPPRQSN
jgi:sigma-B regulation protein RsbU (phosphoserine phosphatase)